MASVSCQPPTYLGGQEKGEDFSQFLLVASWSPEPLKTRRGGQRCMLNLSRAEMSSRWCDVVVRTPGCQHSCRPRHLTTVQN
ncbi:hypothetical protein TNCV_1289401 [Trichonephila clavipes]|nr:hypothetical protein TNCV_1289401 [Trichonephila clavipes]